MAQNATYWLKSIPILARPMLMWSRLFVCLVLLYMVKFLFKKKKILTSSNQRWAVHLSLSPPPQLSESEIFKIHAN